MNAIFRLHRRGIALTVGLTLLTLLAGTALLGLAGHFLTAAALAGATTTFNFFGPSAGIRGLTFVRILSRYGEKLAGHDTTLRIARDLRAWLFGKLLPLAPFGLGRHRSGDLVTRLLGDIDQLDGLLVRAIGPLLALAALALIAILVTVIALPVAGAVLALALLCIGFGIPLLIQRRGRELEQRTARARDDSRAAVLEGLQGAGDLHAMHAQDAWFAHVEARSHALEALERRRARLLTLGTALHNGVVALSLPLLLWLLVDAVHDGGLGAAAAGGLFFMALAVYEAAAGIGLAWQSLQAARVAQQRLQQLAAQAPGVSDPAAPRTVPASGALEFRNVRFHWPEAAGGGPVRDVLHEVNLRLEPGQRIALRGDSGSGKSSLLALALRLCDPQAGSVTHGGIDLREFRQANWHAQVTWLPQEAPVFAGSVRDNLRIGAPDAGDERLWAVLAEVKLDAAIRALPGGLDTWVGEHGATLSAGQSRRLAFARALLREAPLLLLDEPTEGLDTDTADSLLRDFATASAGRSVLIICHGELPDGVVHASLRLVDGRIVGDD